MKYTKLMAGGGLAAIAALGLAFAPATTAHDRPLSASLEAEAETKAAVEVLPVAAAVETEAQAKVATKAARVNKAEPALRAEERASVNAAFKRTDKDPSDHSGCDGWRKKDKDGEKDARIKAGLSAETKAELRERFRAELRARAAF